MAKSHYKDHPWLEILANAFLHQKIKLDPILDEDFSVFHKKRLFRSYFESHFWNELSGDVKGSVHHNQSVHGPRISGDVFVLITDWIK